MTRKNDPTHGMTDDELAAYWSLPAGRALTLAEQLTVADELRAMGWTVTAPPLEDDRQLRDAKASARADGRPAWLVDRDDDDGTEGLRMLGHGLDDV